MEKSFWDCSWTHVKVFLRDRITLVIPWFPTHQGDTEPSISTTISPIALFWRPDLLQPNLRLLLEEYLREIHVTMWEQKLDLEPVMHECRVQVKASYAQVQVKASYIRRKVRFWTNYAWNKGRLRAILPELKSDSKPDSESRPWAMVRGTSRGRTSHCQNQL